MALRSITVGRPKTFNHDELDLVVYRLDPGAVESRSNCIEDMFIVSFCLKIEVMHRWYLTVAFPPEILFYFDSGFPGRL